MANREARERFHESAGVACKCTFVYANVISHRDRAALPAVWKGLGDTAKEGRKKVFFSRAAV